ncbi:permeases of the major facilitator superfamily [Stylonychia lemnae]|uniref:Permeases of the major facilitator superfamily n=1 Tax=Stylonychia lemnae TaxID=5949 RepID=A0A078AM46_STYLE|nr:permeases of the major facilitator superfamily [Stylonychia lemnae]|eukprot:CDW81898.1 permeases of the major facilitator superfamily [Stylonychia lemnae]
MLGMIFSSFLSTMVGGLGPFALFGKLIQLLPLHLGCLFFIFALLQNHIIHFVEFEDHSTEIFNIQVTNIYQQPFITHQYSVKRYSSSSLLEEEAASKNMISNSDNQGKAKKKKKYDNVNYREVLKNRRAIFGFFSIALSLSLWTFIDTTLTNKLQLDFNLTANVVCLFYSIQCAGFLMTSPLMHKFIQRSDPMKMIIIAFMLQGVAVFLMGPSQKLNIPNRMIFTAIGLGIAGFSAPFITIPSYPELRHAMINNEDGKRYDPDQLSNILSGLFNSAFSLGTIVGPITASYITLATNFRNCCDIIAGTTVIFALLYLLVVYIPYRLKSYREEKLRDEQHKQQLVEMQSSTNPTGGV